MQSPQQERSSFPRFAHERKCKGHGESFTDILSKDPRLTAQISIRGKAITPHSKTTITMERPGSGPWVIQRHSFGSPENIGDYLLEDSRAIEKTNAIICRIFLRVSKDIWNLSQEEFDRAIGRMDLFEAVAMCAEQAGLQKQFRLFAWLRGRAPWIEQIWQWLGGC